MDKRQQEVTFGAGVLRIVIADITTLTADALINAANAELVGGGGVDGAIHRAGGPAIMDELRERYTGCPTGSAVITGAGKLHARFVIHAVGPIWRGGEYGEAELLASAYRAAFALAQEQSCTTVATASLSTGVYGFPVERAVPIAIGEARAALEADETPLREITFALFGERAMSEYSQVLEKHRGTGD